MTKKRKAKGPLMQRGLVCSNGSVMVNRDLLRILKANEALLLSYLIDRHFYCRNERDADLLGPGEFADYFICQAKYNQQHLMMSHREEQNAMRRLRDLDFIDVLMLRNPARRHVRIQFQAINSALEKSLES